jgi:hypothetical protein
MSATGDGKYKLKGRYGLTFTANGATNSDPALTVEFPLVRYTGPDTVATRAQVYAAVGTDPPIGAVYFGQGARATTKPNLLVKIANAGASTDWQRVVTQASD